MPGVQEAFFTAMLIMLLSLLSMFMVIQKVKLRTLMLSVPSHTMHARGPALPVLEVVQTFMRIRRSSVFWTPVVSLNLLIRPLLSGTASSYAGPIGMLKAGSVLLVVL
jgi:hypothetical protein